MLKGLEISEILKSELERTARIDSEFYAKENLKALEILEKRNSKSLTEFLNVSDGNHMSISEYFTEKQIPYYRGGDIYNFFIEQTNNPLTIPENVYHWPHMKRSHLKKGDVLISIVGAIIGNLSLVKTNQRATCSCKLAILRPKNIEPELAAIFLKSKYGQNQIQKFRRGSGQTGLILEDFNQLLFPDLSKDVREEIKNLVDISFAKLEQSQNLYTAAETILLETIGLNNFKPSTDPINIKRFKDSFMVTGRLDAEYYQKKYEEVEDYIKNFELGITTISNEFSLSKDIIDRTKDFYNYTEISDINVSDGSVSYNKLSADDIPDNGKMVLKAGQIIISKVRPYRGAIGIIRDCPQNYVGSGAFTILSEKGYYKKEVLQTILRSKPYQELIMKYNVGSSYPVVKDEDILNLPIPKIDNKSQLKIAELVEESFSLKKQSEQLLETAKRAVEIAIEQNEAEALQYIKTPAGVKYE